ncbi:DUF4389 domain-containing protein [Desertimonas flava]|uniref:DUF4389 domain-containing protein n=1 Tax=Desertimonas flava TaxID=2064846 RepID=UPI000E34FA0A|nr:DUF4389 domain-containing protein [Desertimonas flava]
MTNGGSGQAVTFDVQYREGLNRLTTFFRYFTVLPHSIVLGLWGYAVQFATIGQWFVTVFTGKRSRGIWEFQRSWLAYASRVNSYAYLTHDVWPRFGGGWGDEPVAFDHGYVEPANRLTSALRIIWVIPALLILLVLGIGLAVVVLISWFAILFTGRMPRGMFDFAVRVHRFSLNLTAYEFLMTDTYPRYEGSSPVSTLPPGDHGSGRGTYGQVSQWASSPPPPGPAAAPGQPLPPPSGPPA